LSDGLISEVLRTTLSDESNNVDSDKLSGNLSSQIRSFLCWATWLKGDIERRGLGWKRGLRLLDEGLSKVSSGGDDKLADKLALAMYENNLGVVYQNVGKPFTALTHHSLATQHALDYRFTSSSNSSTSKSSTINEFGQITHLPIDQILYNNGICLLKCGDFEGGYSCFSTIISRQESSSPSSSSSSPSSLKRIWLRMGEACVGLWKSYRSGVGNFDDSGSSISKNNFGKWWFSPLGGGYEAIDSVILQPEAKMGSGEDLECFRRNPLARGKDCFERVLKCCGVEEDGLDRVAKINLAFIFLEVGDFNRVLSVIGDSNKDSNTEDDKYNDMTKWYRTEALARLETTTDEEINMIAKKLIPHYSAENPSALSKVSLPLPVGLTATGLLLRLGRYEAVGALAERYILEYEAGGGEGPVVEGGMQEMQRKIDIAEQILRNKWISNNRKKAEEG